MRFTDKLRKGLFLMMLGLGTGVGAPVDPKKIEEVLHLMNGLQVELVLPSNDQPKPPSTP
jgi:hypothetical protein